MDPFVKPRRELLQAILERLVPPAAGLDERARDEVFAIVEAAVAERPPAVARQLGAFLRAIDVLAFLSRGRSFRRLGPEARDHLLRRLERSKVEIVRKGFWGLKALLLMGYYTRPEAGDEIGYRPERPS